MDRHDIPWDNKVGWSRIETRLTVLVKESKAICLALLYKFNLFLIIFVVGIAKINVYSKSLSTYHVTGTLLIFSGEVTTSRITDIIDTNNWICAFYLIFYHYFP